MAKDRKVVALRVPGCPDGAEARRLVCAAMGADPDWGVMEIEIFPGRDGALVLAHPSEGVYIRSDALALLLAGRE